MASCSLDALNNQIRNCRKCSELYRSRLQAVPGTGNPKAKIMFIGLAPGRNGADKTGIPFTRDKTGRLLRKMIQMIALSAEDVYLTNVVKCNPKDSKGRNRKPTREEIQNCRFFLQTEMELVNPGIVVTLGVQATEVVMLKKVDSMKSYNSVVIEKEQRRIVPLFHPGYVIRGVYRNECYKRDFLRLKSLVSIE